MDFEKLSRRDFLKKTTVLAVGVASVALFSGLVNAQDFEPYVQDDGSCVFAQDPEFAGACGYNPVTTYFFACSATRGCCYHLVMCNGREAIGEAWACKEEDMQVCVSFEGKSPPPNLPYCESLL